MAKSTRDPNAWISEFPREEFPGAIRASFDFLCRDYTFKEPVIEKTPLTLSLSYRATRVAIEVSVDFRDRAVEVALVWLLDGQRPAGWKVDAASRQFLMRLYEAAWHRKVLNPRVIVPEGSSPQTILRLWLEAWAQQLRAQFPDVLADSDTLFQELNRQRKQR